MSREDEPRNDSGKLRLLANWFDMYDFNRRIMEDHLKNFMSPKEDDVREEVQIFLRELADRLEEKNEPRGCAEIQVNDSSIV